MSAHRLTGNIPTIPTVQIGYIAGSSVAANSYKDYSLTYPTPFSVVPTTLVAFSTGSTAGGMGKLTVGTLNETASGCTIRVWNGDTTGRSPSLKWVAIA